MHQLTRLTGVSCMRTFSEMPRSLWNESKPDFYDDSKRKMQH